MHHSEPGSDLGTGLSWTFVFKTVSKRTCIVILLADSVVNINRNLHTLLARHVFLLAKFWETRKSLIRAVTLTPAISHRQACLSTYYLSQRIEPAMIELSPLSFDPKKLILNPYPLNVKTWPTLWIIPALRNKNWYNLSFSQFYSCSGGWWREEGGLFSFKI